MLVGIVLAVLIAALYLKKDELTKAGLIDLLICACFAISSGIIFAIVFENIYEMIALGKAYQWCWKMTFYGGVIGGAGGFLLTYFLMRKNVNFDIKKVLEIAPISITLAHAIGRIGCFLAGCCYGVETDSWIGINFPNDDLGKVIPTQLIESLFLFILCGALAVLLLKFKFKYNFVVYMSAYSIFRFIIEFYRGDERGVAFVLSPSQVLSILVFLGSIGIFFVLKNVYQDEKE